MSRRFYIGGDGSNFNIRQVAAGYDALTAPLDYTHFDANHYPGRILNSGSTDCVPYYSPSKPPNGQTPISTTTFAHGCGKRPDLVLGMARPGKPGSQFVAQDGNTVVSVPAEPQTPDQWLMYLYAPDITNASWSGPFSLGNTNMHRKYCTPFRLEGNNRGGAYQSGQGGYYWIGWWYDYDETNINVRLWGPNPLRFKWVALEL